MPALSERTTLIQPSPTLALDTEAKALKARGLDVVNLSIGEPDFPTPAHICRAAVEAIRAGFTRYTASEGILELREAVAGKFKRDNGLSYSPDQVVISCGGKHALYNAFQCLVQKGDEVLIPVPYWVTYPAQALLAGATPVLLETDPKTQLLTPEILEKAITKKTRLLVLNSPGNPSGKMYSPEALKDLAVIIKKADIWVISDDIYENLVYGDRKFANISMVCPELFDRTVIIHGVSKTYSMTGWRIGYLAGPKGVAKAAAKLQSQMTSNPASVAQKAALAALDGPQDCIVEMREAFSRRRTKVMELVRQIPGWECPEPDGAFYVFPRISALYGKEFGGAEIQNSEDLAQVLLKNVRVATVPGTCFGCPDYLRLSYATSLDELEKGLILIRDFLS
ncbi:MAG: pyridoxal phosphate-dependent aminotransferase [Deltaproteobacteria bacterium]|jgi:aspartate aminotransferase|nr:pyridoxal phosphate-dependent aminotransferase [Deltaproteobacteria bacterium]